MSDEPEFTKIHDSFRSRILQYLTRLVGLPEAEDLTQEVFVKVARSLTTFRGESQLSTWIYRIATNAALDHLRSSACQRKAPASEIGEEMTGTAKSAESAVIQTEMNQCVRRHVDALPQNYRTVVVLSEWEGLPNSEIAQILGLSLDTVKIRLHRGRRRLRSELEGNCSFYHDEQNLLACDPTSAR